VSKLRVGIIGLGFIGTAKHLPGLASVADEVDVVGFCDLVEERASKARQEHGSADAYVTTDWHDIVNDESLDVVHVCTWNVSHREITVAALEAGKHVLCEKPMAVTGEEARAMVAAAKAANRKLSVGYQYRWRQDNRFLRNVVDEGRLGEIYHARAHAVRRRGVPIWGAFTDKSKQGGGPLIDLGTHALDLALWYMGNYDVASVTGVVNYKLGDKPEGNMAGPWDPSTFEVEDSAFGFVRMKNGATIFLEAAWALNVTHSREACVTLAGTEGGAENIQIGGDYEVTLNSVVGKDLVTTAPDFKGAYFGASGAQGGGFAVLGSMEAQQWIRAIKEDTDPLVLPEQACVVTEILDAIYRSSESGVPVTF
jgi:predicted dehydrogenase